MLFKTHIMFSLAVYFVLNYFLLMPFWVLGFVLFGAAFVDIDSCSSKVGKRFWFLSWALKHRGFLHGLVGCIFLSLTIGAISLWGGFGFFVGYVSHLFLDCFTLGGVRLFWPFRFKIRGFVRSGSWVEDIVFVLLLVFVVGKIVFETLF